MTTDNTIFKTLDEKNKDIASFSGNAMTARTLRNIEKSLKYELQHTYDIKGESNEKISKSLLKIHGLDIEQFDTVSNIENNINSIIINDESIDPNANKGERTIEGIIQESVAPNKKAVGYDLLYRTMKKLYGKDEAKKLSGLMYTYALALADATAIMKNYCFSVDASKLVSQGRDFGQLKSKPSKHVFSYISALNETIHQLSNHLAGAIAVGTFFLDITKVLIYTDAGRIDEEDPDSPYNGYSIDEFKTNKILRKSVENSFQHFVHSVNHLSRSAVESPFTNISVFDKPKIALLTSDNEMGWMFEERPIWWNIDGKINTPSDFESWDIEKQNKYTIDAEKEIWHKYVVDYIYEVQKVFIEFFDKGDTSSGGLPFRFPIVSVNLSKFKNDDKTEYIKDIDFLNYICSKDISRYNIFCSTGTKIASCCFAYTERPRVKIGEAIYTDTFEELTKVITPSDIVEVEYHDKWVKAQLVRQVIGNHKMFKITTSDYRTIVVSDNHINATDKGDVKTVDITSNHALTCNNGFVKISRIDEIKYDNPYIYCFEIINEELPYFTLANGIITHNCRLINDIEMMEFAGQANSFGGVGVSLGSHRVCTIDFNRIALEAKSYEDYFKILDDRVLSTAKILKAHKELIKMLTTKGLQEFVDNGWLRMDRMFSTFGILGIVEAEETLKRKFGEYNTDTISESLKLLNSKAIEFGKRFGLIINIEQIPGESMAPRLAKADKLIFGEDKVPYVLYANQFIPRWKEASIWDKMDADGKYNRLITGGMITHIQIGEKLTIAQAKKIIIYAMKAGCEHFALNAVYSECKSCGNVHLGKIKICPKCGGQVIEYLTRVVGFFTRVKDWVKERRDWEFDRRTFVDLPKEE